ncbi:hypothetical protein BDN72DRAFT_822099 [Pluteus cervinus]|uniref:Uncharacterized protein n=2 Tax=Pluteus cervinus TaxID=181527 RepID=A0ACD3AQA5_9AGAR|nr:hypothetical protein BDN72DRAFT_965982 [Pluteus cervinus]TFK67697.1 hypothetical protein BDN72DRAFT_822099 [Pluteus cervinus]
MVNLQQLLGNPPAVFCLPQELLDQIFSLIEDHRDLVNFAYASHAAASLVIPHHTEYRIIRVRHPMPFMWAHLARRGDLARNIREVHICDHKNYTSPDRYPLALIDKDLDKAQKNEGEWERVKNMCEALAHMRELRVFTWECGIISAPTKHPYHEDAVLRVLSTSKTLERLALSGGFAKHAPPVSVDPEGAVYPIWKTENLKAITLMGDAWIRRDNGNHMINWLHKSPNLEYLELPMEFPNLASLHLPNLKRVKLLLYSGTLPGIDHSRSEFLENHPLIEDLCWYPIGSLSLSSSCLPNLKRLRGGRQVIEALEESHGQQAEEVVPPRTPPTKANSELEQPSVIDVNSPSSPSSSGSSSVFSSPTTRTSTSTAPSPFTSSHITTAHVSAPGGDDAQEEQMIPYPFPLNPVPTVKKRQIKFLDINSLNPTKLAALTCIDPLSLKGLRLSTFGELDSVHKLAEMFPNIEWLQAPQVHLRQEVGHPTSLSVEEWLDLLPRFRNLQVFRGEGLWSAVNRDKNAMHQVIMQLVQICPRLRELDHCDWYDKFRAYRRIVIERQLVVRTVEKTSGEVVEGRAGERGADGAEYEEVEAELVTYKVVKPRPGRYFDVFDGVLDD